MFLFPTRLWASFKKTRCSVRLLPFIMLSRILLEDKMKWRRRRLSLQASAGWTWLHGVSRAFHSLCVRSWALSKGWVTYVPDNESTYMIHRSRSRTDTHYDPSHWWSRCGILTSKGSVLFSEGFWLLDLVLPFRKTKQKQKHYSSHVQFGLHLHWKCQR